MNNEYPVQKSLQDRHAARFVGEDQDARTQNDLILCLLKYINAENLM